MPASHPRHKLFICPRVFFKMDNNEQDAFPLLKLGFGLLPPGH